MWREERLQESCASSQSEQSRVKAPRPEPEPLIDFNNLNKDKQFLIADSNTEQRIAISQQVSADLQELDAQVKSMMDQSQKMIQSGKIQRRAKICKMCGKEGQYVAIRDHIEAHHLEGVSLPCNVCDKTFRSRNSLRLHKCRSASNLWFIVQDKAYFEGPHSFATQKQEFVVSWIMPWMTDWSKICCRKNCHKLTLIGLKRKEH